MEKSSKFLTAIKWDDVNRIVSLTREFNHRVIGKKLTLYYKAFDRVKHGYFSSNFLCDIGTYKSKVLNVQFQPSLYSNVRKTETIDFHWSNNTEDGLLLERISRMVYSSGEIYNTVAKMSYNNGVLKHYEDDKGNEWKQQWALCCPFLHNEDPLEASEKIINEMLLLYVALGGRELKSTMTVNEKQMVVSSSRID